MKVKIVQAEMSKLPSGKLDFHCQNQTYVTVNEGTANLEYICREEEEDL